MRRRLVDLLSRAFDRGRTAAPSAGARAPASPRRRARAAALLALLALAAAAGCAGSRAGGPDAGAEPGDPVEAEAGDASADDAARRAASDRFVGRGRAALEDGRSGDAADLLERAVRVDPSNGGAYLALAEARLAQGRVEEARGLLERAAALLRDDAPAAARLDSVRSTLPGGG